MFGCNLRASWRRAARVISGAAGLTAPRVALAQPPRSDAGAGASGAGLSDPAPASVAGVDAKAGFKVWAEAPAGEYHVASRAWTDAEQAGFTCGMPALRKICAGAPPDVCRQRWIATVLRAARDVPLPDPVKIVSEASGLKNLVVGTVALEAILAAGGAAAEFLLGVRRRWQAMYPGYDVQLLCLKFFEPGMGMDEHAHQTASTARLTADVPGSKVKLFSVVATGEHLLRYHRGPFHGYLALEGAPQVLVFGAEMGEAYDYFLTPCGEGSKVAPDGTWLQHSVPGMPPGCWRMLVMGEALALDGVQRPSGVEQMRQTRGCGGWRAAA